MTRQVLDDKLLAVIRGNSLGVLTTIKRDGRPQLSNVSYHFDPRTVSIQVSIGEPRAKTRNLRRDPRATLSIIADDWHAYLVVEGICTIVEDDPVPLLRRVYERIRGQAHPNWDEFDAAMRRDGRVVLSISVDRIYPLNRG